MLELVWMRIDFLFFMVIPRLAGIDHSALYKCFFVMAGFPRILKNPCASKENRFPKLNLPTVYQRNRRAKLAINTQTPVQVDLTIGQVFCFLNFFITYSCSSTTYKSNAILFRGNVAMLRLEQLVERQLFFLVGFYTLFKPERFFAVVTIIMGINPLDILIAFIDLCSIVSKLVLKALVR